VPLGNENSKRGRHNPGYSRIVKRTPSHTTSRSPLHPLPAAGCHNSLNSRRSRRFNSTYFSGVQVVAATQRAPRFSCRNARGISVDGTSSRTLYAKIPGDPDYSRSACHPRGLVARSDAGCLPVSAIGIAHLRHHWRFHDWLKADGRRVCAEFTCFCSRRIALADITASSTT